MPWHRAIYATRSWLLIVTLSIAIQATLFGAGFSWLASADRRQRHEVVILQTRVSQVQQQTIDLSNGVNRADAHLRSILDKLTEVDLRMIQRIHK